MNYRELFCKPSDGRANDGLTVSARDKPAAVTFATAHEAHTLNEVEMRELMIELLGWLKETAGGSAC